MNASERYYNTVYRLWSVIAFGAGTTLLGKISGEFDSAEDIYHALARDGAEHRMSAAVVEKARSAPVSAAEKIYDHCEKKGISIVTFDDELYPQRLKCIDFPPPVLFYKGDISDIDNRLGISVVGTRNPSDYSLRVTAGMVRVLARLGFDIVSGFAEGIDICAHRTAADSGGRTFAVLGAGIDVDYPKKNSAMRSRITENGALITEYLPGTSPFPRNFPQRNRILSGLTMSAAVIEAGEASGSLNTASHAAEQGKTVFVVPPHDLFDKRYSGNMRLLRDGAVPLMGISDITFEYCSEIQHTIDESSELYRAIEVLREFGDVSARDEAQTRSEKKNSLSDKPAEAREKKLRTDNGHTAEETAVKSKTDPADFDGIQLKILTALNGGSMRADDIAAATGEDIGSVLASLTELEITGAVSAKNGSYRAL
ncbi:MAG: DNA-processing protein DprA [Ruminococcus sp.]|nr:DNA-processing protein DprA [Ruminococcus sp.]